MPVTRALRPDERPAAIDTLARAFADDPMFAWLFPARRLAALRFVFAASLRPVERTGEAIVPADGAGAGVNAFFAPGRRSLAVGWLGFLAGARPPIPWRSLGRLRAGLRVVAAMEAAHPAAPHYYVQSIAVHPDHQGRGLGGALLRPVLDRADADGAPVYLETTRPENLAFYRRFGFELTGELRAGAAPPVWTMSRPA